MRYNFTSVMPMTVEFLGQVHTSMGSIPVTDLHVYNDIYKIPHRSPNLHRSINGAGIDYRVLNT